MKVLYITAYPVEYWSSANIRNLGLLGGLMKDGNEVSTLSPYPYNKAFYSGELSDLPFKKRYWIGGFPSDNDKIAEKVVVKKPSRLKMFLSRAYSSFSIYDRRSWLTKQISRYSVDEDFDVIISSSDPKSAHLLAEKLIKEKPSICKKWIQYWGDPFVGDITSRYSMSSYFVKREERRLIKLCDKAVFVSPFTVEEVKKRLPELNEKIVFIPIPYIESGKRNGEQKDECTLISYLGNYTVSRRDIRPLVEVINELSLPAAIIGDSDIEIKSNDHLIVRGRMNSKELQEITDQTKIFVCVCNKHGSQIPGKIYHYVDTGRPILIILDGEYSERMKAFFETFNRFYLCNNEIESIKETILTIIKENKSFDIPESLRPITIARQFLSV